MDHLRINSWAHNTLKFPTAAREQDPERPVGGIELPRVVLPVQQSLRGVGVGAQSASEVWKMIDGLMSDPEIRLGMQKEVSGV